MAQKREIITNGPFAVITLTRGFKATIDIVDLPLVAGCNWTALVCGKRVYAYRQSARPKAGTMIYLHRLIMDAKPGDVVDHINGDTLDNTRTNLRLATCAQNCQNSRKRSDSTSNFKGVAWHKNANKWVAYINKDLRRVHLGTFSAKEDAIAAVRSARKSAHGDFARHA